MDEKEYRTMMRHTESHLFRYRWAGHTVGLQEVIVVMKVDPDWHKSEAYKTLLNELGPLPEDVKVVERDLRAAPLSGADLMKANLSRADLMKANLSGAHLRGADLSGANLWGADLVRADLWGANLSGANLWRANLSEANLSGANLTGANLWEANLLRADLWKANLSGAHLREANLSGANLWGANLAAADLWEVLYTTDEVLDRLMEWWGPRILKRIYFLNHLKGLQKLGAVGITNFEGVDTAKINGSKNPILKRHIEDYQFIQGFKRKSWFHQRILYPLWKGTSDCGRSLLLWLIWSMGLMGLFVFVYSNHLEDWFNEPGWGWFDVFYFSVIKFATLSFVSIAPRSGNTTAQVWGMAEVIIRYIMLGSFISILVNKLARRA
jgi:hypothetical protein